MIRIKTDTEVKPEINEFEEDFESEIENDNNLDGKSDILEDVFAADQENEAKT